MNTQTEQETEAQRGERWARYFHSANAIDQAAPHTREGREQAKNAQRLARWRSEYQNIELPTTGTPYTILKEGAETPTEGLDNASTGNCCDDEAHDFPVEEAPDFEALKMFGACLLMLAVVVLWFWATGRG